MRKNTLPHAKRRELIALRTVAVYRYGQPRDGEPACVVSKYQASEWVAQGAGRIDQRGTVLVLNRPQVENLVDCVRCQPSLASLVHRVFDRSEETQASIAGQRGIRH